MGQIQGAINSMIGTVAGATAIKKHFTNQDRSNKLLGELGSELAARTDFAQLNAEQAFVKSNQALVGELSKKRAGLLRSRRMLEKTGKWGIAQENRLANLEQEISRYSNAGSQVQDHIENTLSKLGKGSSTMFEEVKK